MQRLKVLAKFLHGKTSIPKEEEVQDTYQEICEGASLSGANFWMLCITMFIACIGLNADSIAAVIGAMLLSPLMGPIIAFAFSMSVNDTKLKQRSIRNWIWMTGISLFASTLFFVLSPFDDNTTALASFTRANIFDILLAFFGGVAGFIGITKKDGVKVMSGVAVATACMPPLCTAGFGIAHADVNYFLGGLYFYLVNCLFIGVATFLTSSVMQYRKAFNEVKTVPKTHTIIWALLVIAMLLPGVYLAYEKWQEQTTTKKESSKEDRITELERKIHILDSTLAAAQKK
jgi:uncharacterized hydrophobic protein (TIGR00341 family)